MIKNSRYVYISDLHRVIIRANIKRNFLAMIAATSFVWIIEY